MYIGIDFDGTCATHDFPKIGKDIGAVPVLKRLVENGHQLILFTMRSDKKEVLTDHYEIHSKAEPYLTEAVNWFEENGIELFGIQTNPTQSSWTESPKAYCHLYIDDAALGCPLKSDSSISNRPFVDWNEVEMILVKSGHLKTIDNLGDMDAPERCTHKPQDRVITHRGYHCKNCGKRF